MRLFRHICLVANLLWTCFAALSDDADMLKAAAAGDVEKVMQHVNARRISLTTKNNNGVSALIFAANNGHLRVAEELLKAGANIEDKSNNWKTPLLWASLWEHFDIVRFLVRKGANIDAKDIYGLTPVMSATLNGHRRIVEFLIDCGANLTIRNHYNATALTIARTKQDVELTKLLAPHFPANDDEDSPFIIAWTILTTYVWFMFDIIVAEVKSILGLDLNNPPLPSPQATDIKGQKAQEL